MYKVVPTHYKCSCTYKYGQCGASVESVRAIPMSAIRWLGNRVNGQSFVVWFPKTISLEDAIEIASFLAFECVSFNGSKPQSLVRFSRYRVLR